MRFPPGVGHSGSVSISGSAVCPTRSITERGKSGHHRRWRHKPSFHLKTHHLAGVGTDGAQCDHLQGFRIHYGERVVTFGKRQRDLPASIEQQLRSRRSGERHAAPPKPFGSFKSHDLLLERACVVCLCCRSVPLFISLQENTRDSFPVSTGILYRRMVANRL